MSDQHPDDHPADPELTAEQETEVRRLLADARHDEPIPDHLGARLDAVLAGLSRDEPGTDGVAPVIDLAARRRRRNAAAVLAGAAAVIVAGFGIGQVIDVGSSSDDTGSAGASADRSVSGPAQHNLDDGAGSPGAESPESPEAGAAGGDSSATSALPDPIDPMGGLRAPLSLRSDHLQQDLSRQLGRKAAASYATDAKAFSAAGCPEPAADPGKFGLGELFPALFDDAPAVVALRPPSGGTRQADVLDCDSAATLASVTLPAP